jgi:uncharacterized protein with NAD-binding domain and iron-sulfur cluster
MFERVKTVSTQSFQFWMTEETAALGGQQGGLLGTHVEPIDTECDMTLVLEHEDWRKVEKPAKSLAYLCGVLPDADSGSQPQADAAAQRNAADYVATRQDLRFVYPKAFDGADVRWEAFADDQGRNGAARFAYQYTRANVSPSERYTLSVPGSTDARLRAEQSGFGNCVLCGDWTRNNYNAGCVEATVVSGMFAVRALGYSLPITAEDDGWFWEHHAAGDSLGPAPLSTVPPSVEPPTGVSPIAAGAVTIAAGILNDLIDHS